MQLGKSIAVALFMLALLAVPATTSRAKEQALNPSELCTMIFGDFGGTTTHGGCVSTIATGGDLSSAAYAGRCKSLREMADMMAEELGEEADDWFYDEPDIQPGEPPINMGGFGGTIGSCKPILEGYHTGKLTHPEPE